MFPREGALINGVPVVVGCDKGGLSVGSIARRDAFKVTPCEPTLELGPSSCQASADLEYWPLLEDRVDGISLPCVAPYASSPDAEPPRLRFNLARAGLVGVEGTSTDARFSHSSSLCFSIFFRSFNHDSFIASLSYAEKGRGGCLRAVEEPVTGGGNGESGSSMASGDM